MILVKITNEQLFALKADSNFAPLADSLLSIQSLRTARGGFKPRRDGWIEVDEEYLSFATLQALSAVHSIEIGDMVIYTEVSTARLAYDIPSYLPNATREEMNEDDEIVVVNNKWEDLKSRTSLSGSKHICSIRATLSLDVISQLINETGVLVLNHTDTLAKIHSDYQESDI